MEVRTYGQYCPIARASELLAERWSFIILRNIVLIGCRTFNEIADGAPGLSRGLLSKRLRDLERAGVIEIRPKPDGPGSTYEPTQAGRELSEVMLALQHWGSQWAELTPEHAHLGVVLRSARSIPAGKKIWWSWSAIRWRSPAGISASSSGATPCAAGRSRCGAGALARALPTWKRRVDPVQRPPAARQATTPA